MGGVGHLLAEGFALVGNLVSRRGSSHLAEGYSPEKEIAVSCHKPTPNAVEGQVRWPAEKLQAGHQSQIKIIHIWCNIQCFNAESTSACSWKIKERFYN